jgi:hypothetical protein
MTSVSVFLRIRNILQITVEEIKTHIFTFSNSFPGNRVDYEMMWKKHIAARQATGGSIT